MLFCIVRGSLIRALPDAEDPIGTAQENPYFHKLDHGLSPSLSFIASLNLYGK